MTEKSESQLWYEFINADLIQAEKEREIRKEIGNDEYYSIRIKEGYKFNNEQLDLFD